MLIDATHREETRVVVLSGKRLDDFEVEAEERKQLKGNIYLAKVTRVEPSLQAAFVDFGGNRHGFLAFNEIHPDYYQIPIADREALMVEQKAAERAAAEADDAEAEQAGDPAKRNGRRAKRDDGENGVDVETLDGDEAEEVAVRHHAQSLRNYKIQEVIKRRQILLVQVVKEERGNKGAALTTYLSLAGRYCVIMPNTARGGGISRKIASGTDRQRLKSILKDMDIPDGMAVIVRTAGAQRNKTEIKRDYGYLLRLWESVREMTLRSIAPSLVYEEANLIKRTIRDLYSNDVTEILVDGEEGFQAARSFMRLLTPSHTKKVKANPTPEVPLYQRHGVEAQLEAVYNPEVQLRSGGYIVINPTEALVSIDVNSGRSTRERNIEETALKTNLEAADEIARQLRLRELAGLVVIDFIDMEVNRNQAQVERRIKGAMRNDRARIQIGRISAFGLLELSRQRLHASLFETCFEPVPHSTGVGYRRSVPSSALLVLRAIEAEGLQKRASEISVHVPAALAIYLLNHKRAALSRIETYHDMRILFAENDSLDLPEHRIQRTKTRPDEKAASDEKAEMDEKAALDKKAATDEKAKGDDKPVADESPARDELQQADGDEEEGGRRKRRRRPRRRRREEPADTARIARTDEAGADVELTSDAEAPETSATPETSAMSETSATPENSAPREAAEAAEDGAKPRRRRRGRRGSRRREGESEVTGDSRGAEAAEAPEPIAAEILTYAPPPFDEVAESRPEAEAVADADAGPDRDITPEGETVEEPASWPPAASIPDGPPPLFAPLPDTPSPIAAADATFEPVARDIVAMEGDLPAEEGADAENGDVRRTQTTVVGTQEPADPSDSPRKGWWQRLMS